MITCLKNGVIIYSCEYRCYFRGDVYRLEGYGWLFRVNNNRMFDCEHEDFKVYEIDLWPDEHKDQLHSTMLVRDDACLFSDEFQKEYLDG